MTLSAAAQMAPDARPAEVIMVPGGPDGPFPVLMIHTNRTGYPLVTVAYPPNVPLGLVHSVAAAHNAAMDAAMDAPQSVHRDAPDADPVMETLGELQAERDMPEESDAYLKETAAGMMAEGAKPSFDPVDRDAPLGTAPMDAYVALKADPNIAPAFKDALPVAGPGEPAEERPINTLVQPPIADLNPAKMPRPDGWEYVSVVRGQNPGSFHNWTFRNKSNGREIKVSHPSEPGAWIELARAIREGRA